MTLGKLGSSCRFPDIEVLVISGRGQRAALNALSVVANQAYEGWVHTLLICDDWAWTGDMPIETERRSFRRVSIVNHDQAKNQTTMERVARLRNVGLSLSSGSLLCFLDDDNDWSHNHLSSLSNVIQSKDVDTAYCWRRILDEDGREWDGTTFPWGYEPDRKREIFDRLEVAGVVTKGSNVFRDTLFFDDGGQRVGLVDMGSWLFRRHVFDSIRFEDTYTDWEIIDLISEDDKLSQAILDRGFSTSCSEQPTLTYRLGGFSNGRDESLQDGSSGTKARQPKSFAD